MKIASAPDSVADSPLAIYVHWPFCLSKCPYCDFNSHVRESVNQAAWKAALLQEIAWYAERTQGRIVGSIFFGGGTPSLMPPDTVAAVIDAIRRHWRSTNAIEITLEANPTSSEIQKFRHFADAGVNRVSLGVQALDDEVLRFLGRTHSAQHALQAVEMAASTFGRYSFDLIYARPEQTAAQWRQELTQALLHAGEHLSLYQLTIEPSTAFYHAHARGDLVEIDEDSAAALYLLTQEVMEAHGLPAYEISNHARIGSESRHNLAYWRYEDYLGIGPGAHGRIPLDGQKLATQAHRSPEKWLAMVQEHGHGLAERTPLSPQEQLQEALLMGLRLEEGIDAARFATALNPRAVSRLKEAGWLTDSDNRLRIIGEGRLCLNSVIAELAV